MEGRDQELLTRLATLERRLLALEGIVFKRGGLGRAVREMVSKWPGPFTATQIRDAVYEVHPETRPLNEEHQVSTIVTRMQKAGFIVCTFRGAGPTPNIYERAQHPPTDAGRPGSKFGRKYPNESGFRSIVRSAMEELPEHFTIGDLRSWVAKRLPDASIPYGSWSSTLYKMQLQQELVVVKNGGRSTKLKVYARGPRRITPTGDELRDLEESWREFRKGIVVPDAESLTPLQRANTDD